MTGLPMSGLWLQVGGRRTGVGADAEMGPQWVQSKDCITCARLEAGRRPAKSPQPGVPDSRGRASASDRSLPRPWGRRQGA